MGDIVDFRRPKRAKKHQGNTLCRRGFHKWVVVNKPFDLKQGKLVTCYRCERCGQEKTESV